MKRQLERYERRQSAKEGIPKEEMVGLDTSINHSDLQSVMLIPNKEKVLEKRGKK